MKPALGVAALLLALMANSLAASEGTEVWVPGHWQPVGCEQIWVPGSYCLRPISSTTTTTTTVTTVTVEPPPPPPQVYVAERWLWTGSAWQLQPAHWEVVGAPTVVTTCPPPVTTTQVVEVHHYDRRPPVTFGVGVIIGGGGYHHHYHDDDGDHGHGGDHHFSPPPPLPGSHFLPRPPHNLPDPLGLFRNDPLGLIHRR